MTTTTLDDVRTLRKLIMALDEQLDAYLSTLPDPTEAADVFLELNLAKRDLSFVYGTIERKMISLLDEDMTTLRDGAEIERKTGATRTKWQHKDLATAVADRIVQSSVDMDTGEIVLNPQEVAEKMLDYVQPSYWRATKLNEIGINPDNYCESEVKTNLVVRKGNAQ